jgi:hypothetical protein
MTSSSKRSRSGKKKSSSRTSVSDSNNTTSVRSPQSTNKDKDKGKNNETLTGDRNLSSQPQPSTSNRRDSTQRPTTDVNSRVRVTRGSTNENPQPSANAQPGEKTKRTNAVGKRTSPIKNVEIEAPPKPRIDLTKLKNPIVRREAAKLTARVDKFQLGLDLGHLAGVKILSGMSVEEQLQKIFELADANGDAKLLRQLSDATSFKGKLSPSQPTTEAGRAVARIVQLFNATEGNGSYQTVKDNINSLATDAIALRQMARDINVLQGLDNAQYVDPNRLLRTVGGTPAQQINETAREWHIEQASLMKAYRELAGKDATLQKKLALTMLQSFAKAAPLGAAKAEELGAQVSPLLSEQAIYHRSATKNPLLETVLVAFCQDMGLPMGSAHLVNNATFREVIAREYAMAGVNTQISSQSDFEKALQDLFSKATRGEFPTNKVVLDITDLFKQANLEPKQINQMVRQLEKTFLDKAEKFLNTHPGVDRDKFDRMMMNLQIGAMASHKGVDVLLTPPFLLQGADAGESALQSELLKTVKLKGLPGRAQFYIDIEHSMIHSGYRLDPIQARKAWLEVADPSAILGKYGIQITELATADKPTPKVFASFKDFTDHASFKRFEAIANSKDAPPYLKTLPKATANMLRGLADYNKTKGGVDKAMRDQGLDEVLQTSYFRMLNAMATAVQQQDDLVGFLNQVEVIQQQMATLLSLLEPYGANAFGDSIRAKLTAPTGPGNKPVIPSGLDKPGVQLKPSAMHCLASILSSVEALKKSNNLNVCVVKDHYYESAGAVTTSGTYSVSQFDGDSVRGPDGVSTKPLDPASIQGKKPLDVYVCDFHHNISLDRNHYQIENLQHHVDELYRNKLVADKFTVAIDCTIDFVTSKDVQAFLEHNKDRIAAGKLNVVLFRSAQKFDMLGMDNYYGGFSVNINNHTAFTDFNTRMEAPEDQLKGASLQGLSHIGVSASEDTDEYRNALMASTKRFYDALPPGLIWSPGSTSAMQVARTDDPNAVFLDIKFPGNDKASEAFMNRLKAFALEEGLPLTGRASFGFATTNLNLIHGEQTRLTPGLEGPEIQDRYIDFFAAVYKCANDAVKTATQQGLQGAALNTFVAKQIKDMTL